VVSVIMPTAYAERGSRLQSALASVWAQRGLGEEFELEPIVVDDGSMGNSEQIAARFPGTRYIGLSPNRGLPAARNVGLAEATGDYVAFLDDDDLWLPHRLDRQVAALEAAPDLEVAYGQNAVMRGDRLTGVFPRAGAPSGWLQELAMKEAICPIMTVLVPRAAIEKIGGFDDDLSVWEDHDFLARLAFFFPFRYVEGVVAIYLASMEPRTPEQFHAALLKRRDNILAVIEGHTNKEQLTQLVVATTAWNAARYSYQNGDVRQARVELLQGLEQFPAFERDAWALSRLKELIVSLAIASESPVREISSLCASLAQARGEPGLRARVRMRLFCAEIWTAAATALASDGRHGGRPVRAAVTRAIVLDPRKSLFQPRLIRLGLRAGDDR
jgi:glycosyltransferase involved in cell wall biosynthesis